MPVWRWCNRCKPWPIRPKTRSCATSSRTSAPGWRAATASPRRCRSIPRRSTGFTWPWLARAKKAVCWRKSWPGSPFIWKTRARLRKKVKSAMMYPTVVTSRGHWHHRLPAGQSHPRVRRHLLRLRRQTARADAVPHQPQRRRARATSCLSDCWRVAAAFTAGSISSRPRTAASSGTRAASNFPIFGVIAHKICLARFTRTLASLDSQRRADPGSAANRLANRRQRGHGKSHQGGRPPTSSAARASPWRWANTPSSRT